MKRILGLLFIVFTLCSCESLRNIRKESRFVQCKDPNCINCKGIGYTTCTICNGSGSKICLKCGGAGFYICGVCNGSGVADCFNILCNNGKYPMMKTVPAPTVDNPYAVKVITEYVQCESCGGSGTRSCPRTIACPTNVSCPITVACPKGYTRVWWQCRNCGQKYDYKPKKCTNCGKR